MLRNFEGCRLESVSRVSFLDLLRTDRSGQSVIPLGAGIDTTASTESSHLEELGIYSSRLHAFDDVRSVCELRHVDRDYCLIEAVCIWMDPDREIIKLVLGHAWEKLETNIR